MMMRIFAWACLAILIWLNCVEADADFLDVRIRLEKERNGRKEDPVDKYFRMSIVEHNADADPNGLSQMNLRSSSR